MKDLRVDVTLGTGPGGPGSFSLKVTAAGGGLAKDDLYDLEQAVCAGVARLLSTLPGVALTRGPFKIPDHG